MNKYKVLIHASKYGGFVTKNGRMNNSADYNHNYYMANKEKWGEDGEWIEPGSENDELGIGEKYKIKKPSLLFDSLDAEKIYEFEDGSTMTKYNDKHSTYKGKYVYEKSGIIPDIPIKVESYTSNKTKKYRLTDECARDIRNDLSKKADGAKVEVSLSYRKDKDGSKGVTANYILDNGSDVSSVRKKAKHSDSYSEELYHYGVLGMKWGVRKNPGKAYSKAINQLEKYDRKAARGKARDTAKANLKVAKLRKQAAKYQRKSAKIKQKAMRTFFPMKAEKALAKSWKYDIKAAKKEKKAAKIDARIKKGSYQYEKYTKKGEKMYKQMNSIFANVPTSKLNKTDIDRGKAYAKKHGL